MIKGASVLFGAVLVGAPALAFDAAHLTQVMAGRDCPECDLSHADLDHIDLAGANLAGANFTGANLRAADLRGVDLSNALLTGAVLHGAILRAALLDSTEMSNVLAAGADLRGAGFASVTLARADFYMADFSGADFYQIDLSAVKSTISMATFTDAYFCEVTLAESFASSAGFCEEPETSSDGVADPVAETTPAETGVIPLAEEVAATEVTPEAEEVVVAELAPETEVAPEPVSDPVDLVALLVKANQYYSAEDYENAFPAFKQVAEGGGSGAYVWLAYLYSAGLGTDTDPEQALRWFREAAALGDSYAIDQVAQITAAAETVAARASTLANLSVEDLLALAAEKLAEGDRTFAQEAYQMAADLGSPEAWYQLGVQTEDWEPQNPKNIKALDYWQKSADLGYLKAQVRLAKSYRNGDFGTAKDMDKAIAMLIKMSDQGSVEANTELGYLYVSEDVPMDHAESFKWLKKAAEMGDVNAASWTGYYYAAGQGTDRNLERSLFWHRQAAEGGNEFSKGQIPELEAEFAAAGGASAAPDQATKN